MLCSIVMGRAMGPVNKAHTLDRCTAYNLQSPSASVSGSYDALYKLLSVKDLWGKQLGWGHGGTWTTPAFRFDLLQVYNILTYLHS